MGRVGEEMRLKRRIEADAVAWYAQARVPLAFQKAHPLVLARAALEADNDWSRCLIDDDGSITVYATPQW